MSKIVSSLQISCAYVSECGQRQRNEDQAAWHLSANGDYIAILADGMGGGADGHLFSSRAVSQMTVRLLSTEEEQPDKALYTAVVGTAEDILAQRIGRPEYALSGSTLCAALIRPASDIANVWIAWVGDSRIYHVAADRRLRLLTQDHVYARQLREEGLSQKEIDEHKDAGNLTHSLGDQLVFEPIAQFFGTTSLHPGERLLFCSDGVSKTLGDDEADLAKLISTGTAEQAARALTRQALARGSTDNVTALVVIAGRPQKLGMLPLVLGAGLLVLVAIVAAALFFARAEPTLPPGNPSVTSISLQTAAPVATIAPLATRVNTSTPAPSLTPVPTNTPTNTPTHTPTNTPTHTPTRRPTRIPTRVSTTVTPSGQATTTPPTASPTPSPTASPTPSPTASPTPSPTETLAIPTASPVTPEAGSSILMFPTP